MSSPSSSPIASHASSSSSSASPSTGVAADAKLEKLRKLLGDALIQIRRKLTHAMTFLQNLETIDSINSDTKLLCTILIEIKELLKHFPSLNHEKDEAFKINGTENRFQKFQKNVVSMLEDIQSRLCAVEEFINTTESLPKAMAVAVTVRDITKHLKIVVSRGQRIIDSNTAGTGALAPVDLQGIGMERTQSVLDIVAYYTDIAGKQVETAERIHASHSNPSVNTALSSSSSSSSSNGSAEPTPSEIPSSSSSSSSPPSSDLPETTPAAPPSQEPAPEPEPTPSPEVTKSDIQKTSGDDPTPVEKRAGPVLSLSVPVESTEPTSPRSSSKSPRRSPRKSPSRSPRHEESEVQLRDPAAIVAARTREKSSRRMTVQEKEKAEQAVLTKLNSISSLSGEDFSSMIASRPSFNPLKDDWITTLSSSQSTPVRSVSLSIDESKIYRSGFLKKQNSSMFGKSMKSLWWTMDGEKLSCFQGETGGIPLKSYNISDFKSTSWQGKSGPDLSAYSIVTLSGKNDRHKLVLSADEPIELIRWIIALDTLQNYKDIQDSVLNPLEKHRFLKTAFKDNFKGGEIKSSYEEEWTYTKDGLLKSSAGVPFPLAFRWDGEMLIGVDKNSTLFGSGKWNGVSLIWYDEAANGMITTPTMRFDWNENDREYSDATERSQVWKWTRHFLASKFGAGEWIVEGNIPEPVVMFLQMLRVSRLRKMIDDPHISGPD